MDQKHRRLPRLGMLNLQRRRQLVCFLTVVSEGISVSFYFTVLERSFRVKDRLQHKCRSLLGQVLDGLDVAKIGKDQETLLVG